MTDTQFVRTQLAEGGFTYTARLEGDDGSVVSRQATKVEWLTAELERSFDAPCADPDFLVLVEVAEGLRATLGDLADLASAVVAAMDVIEPLARPFDMAQSVKHLRVFLAEEVVPSPRDVSRFGLIERDDASFPTFIDLPDGCWADAEWAASLRVTCGRRNDAGYECTGDLAHGGDCSWPVDVWIDGIAYRETERSHYVEVPDAPQPPGRQ